MLGFFYDMTKCVGCKACQMACKEIHHLPVGDFYRRVETIRTDALGPVFFSGACNHCADPACVKACPTGAMFTADDGTVQHRDDLCIGCGRCVHQCPYGAPSLNSVTGYAQKCDSCAERRSQGKNPACVDACPTRALRFAELESSAALPFLPSPHLTSPNLAVKSVLTSPDPAATDAIPPVLFDTPVSVETNDHIVIIGGGAAAMSVARTIRKHSSTARITIVSRDPHLSYSRPMLSKQQLNSYVFDRSPILPQAWLQTHQITYLPHTEVLSMDTAAHTICLSNGTELAYDRCILATGAQAAVPPIPGRDLPGVYTLRDETDLHQIRQTLLTARHAVVIGGGITGLEFAWELKRAGLDVTVLDLAPYLAERVLDAHSAKRLQEALEAEGISIATDIQIQNISGTDHVQEIIFTDERVCPADIVILSTGFRPNIALAKAAGIAVERGIMVNERMETSAADVYACGDCTNHSSATWLQSLRQGETAAMNALGINCTYTVETEPAIFHTAQTSLVSIGDPGKQANRTYSFLYAHHVRNLTQYEVNPRSPRRIETHFTFCFCEGHLAGAVLVGDLSFMPMAKEAVAAHWDSTVLRAALTQEGAVIDDE